MISKLDFREEHISLVAKWWADQFRKHLESPNSMIINDHHLTIADKMRRMLHPPEEKILVFEHKLAELLCTSECPKIWEERTAGTWGIVSTRHVLLNVDYHAAGLLLVACRFAKISDMAFPWKTNMTMRYDYAEVRRYGDKPFYLYGKPMTDNSHE